MDEFERLEAGLSREIVGIKGSRKVNNGWTDTILSCFVGTRDEDQEIRNEDAPFAFNKEPIAFTLLASTQIVFDTVSALTSGISSLFFKETKQQQQSATETPLEIIIDGAIPQPSVAIESPKMSMIVSENYVDSKAIEQVEAPTVEDYDGTGFWEDHLDDESLSENEAFYGIDSYIDPARDDEIVMQPINKKSNKKSVKVRFEPIVEFMNSAVINDRVVIKAYLQSGHFNVNVRDKIGYTILHYASASGHADLIKYLLDQGADINLPELEGWTALHFAAIADQFKACKLLLEKGANLECPNDEGAKPVDLTSDLRVKKLFEEAEKKKLSAKKVKALYDWDAESDQDLTIKKGQTLKVKERYDSWWLVQDESKQLGLVPRIFVQNAF